eukprot:scaffold8090_cov82-Cylindrotheca_fusiformis.AAC.5
MLSAHQDFGFFMVRRRNPFDRSAEKDIARRFEGASMVSVEFEPGTKTWDSATPTSQSHSFSEFHYNLLSMHRNNELFSIVEF